MNKVTSRIFVVLYIIATLVWRFLFEAQLVGNALISMGIGVFFLLFLWAMIKSKFLNPQWSWFEQSGNS